MPLPGGAADKVGNRYERWWTVDAFIDVIEQKASSIQIEVPGDEGRGAEFCLTQRGEAVWHQVKRQTAGAGWTVKSLRAAGVLEPFWDKINAGDRCVFVSTNSAGDLRELMDRAIAADSWTVFDRHMLAATRYRQAFAELRECWGLPPQEVVFGVLASERFTVRVVDEERLRIGIVERLGRIVTGVPEMAALVLSDLAESSLHKTLYADDLWVALAGAQVHDQRRTAPRPPAGAAATSAPVGTTWTAGTEVRVAGQTYLLCQPYLAEEHSPDRVVVHRRAQALPVSRSARRGNDYVWLRQVVVTPQPGRETAGHGAAAALARERTLLDRLRPVTGVPSIVDFSVEGGTTTLLVDWPTSKADLRPCGTLDEHLDLPADDPWILSNLLAGLSTLGVTVTRLHRLGASHRCLTTSGVIVLADRLFGLRDLGLAACEPSRGEGPPEGQAPEQVRPSRFTPGPATDVYQLAALTYRLLAGRQPRSTHPPLINAYAPLLLPDVAATLDAALRPDPAARPDFQELQAALQAGAGALR